METTMLERPLDMPAPWIDAPSQGSHPLLLRDQVTARMRMPQARERVARNLTQLVEDAPAVAAFSAIPHLRDALDEPIAAATAIAIETLVAELADLLDLLPETASEALDRARLRADLGLE